jgi:hypothetical protein
MPPGAGFHRSGGKSGVHLWLTDGDGHLPGALVGGPGFRPGELMSEAEAHELGMALVRAADVLRREAQR